MEARVVEISGYVGAFTALYMTKKNCTRERVDDILEVVDGATDRRGFVIPDSPYHDRFMKYLQSVLKYGVQAEHGTLLDYIDITVLMFGLHRGAQDDYDAHAKRMTIIRTSSRYKEFEKATEISDWYKGKIITFHDYVESYAKHHDEFEEEFTDASGTRWLRTAWGYVNAEYIHDGDVCRGLVTLAVASDNSSKMSYRNWRHVYHLRRPGSHAAPELQQAVEMVRDNLWAAVPPLGNFLGKVWVPTDGDAMGHYAERTQVRYTDDE